MSVPIEDPVTFLGRSAVRNLSGHYSCTWDAPPVPHALVQVTFDSTSYPLLDHCRFARIPEGKRRTFVNTEFALHEPGIRVGPWPGWRGIPELPKAFLKTGDHEHEIRYQLWGDEFATHRLRAVCRLNRDEQSDFTLRVSHPGIIPLEAEFFEVPRPDVASTPFVPSHGHPRLLVRPDDLPALRENETRRGIQLLTFVANWDRPLNKTEESKIGDGPEGLAPEDRLLIASYLALLDPTSENVARARSAYFAYVHLTERPDFEPLSIDTQSGEVLFLLCIGYDWLYASLSVAEREEARKRLWSVAGICWKHLGYERDDFAQAHFLGCGMGLVAFSLLFPDEHPRSREWGSYLLGVLHWIRAAVPADGFHPHGINLWIYEMGFLLRWIEMFRTAGGVDLWGTFTTLSASSQFRGSATSSDGLYGITMGDPQFRVGGDSWHHFLIASRTGSGEAQWLGGFLREAPPNGVDFRNAPARRRVYEHLWFDSRIDPVQPERSMDMYADGGQIFVKTSDSLITFRSGPPAGHQRRSAGVLGGYGHSDPCNGSVLIRDKGTFLLSGPGPVYRRETANHNVITFDGEGQIGDSTVWLPDFVPTIPSPPVVTESGSMVAVAADLAPCYFAHIGVRKLRRHLLIQPGRFVLGGDEIELSRQRVCEWNFHTWERFVPDASGDGLAFSIGEAALMFFRSGLEWESGETQFVPAYPNEGTRDRFLRVSLRSDAVLMFWCVVLSQDLRVEMVDGRRFSFSDGTTAAFGDEGFQGGR